MNAALKKLFDALEIQRQQLLDEMKNIDNGSLNNRSQNKWSISQIAGHLITSEKLSTGYIKKKINAINEVDNTGLFGELKLLTFIISQRLPLKYKASKNMGDNPNSYPDMASLIKDWDETRQDINLLLEKFPDDGLKKKIYRHPVMGRSNILHCLIFFREHIIHHYPQIKRQL